MAPFMSRVIPAFAVFSFLFASPLTSSLHAEEVPVNTLASVLVVSAARPLNAVRLDGRGLDPVWARATQLPALLRKDGSAEPAATGTRVSTVRVGRWLLVRLEALDPGELVAREGVHGGDPWFEDELGVVVKGARERTVYVNPLGTVWCAEDGKASLAPFLRGEVLAAARLTETGWSAELAVDLKAIGAEEVKGGVGLRAIRQRQQRGLDAYREAVVPARPNFLALELDADWAAEAAVSVEAAPPEPFAGRAVLAAARVEVAPVTPEEWLRVPPVLLRDGNGRDGLDSAFQPTILRAAATGTELVLNVFCREAHPDTIENPGTALWREDNLELFLGPESYGYLQLIVGPNGKVEAASGQTGGKRVRGMAVPEGIKAELQKADGGWRAVVRIPFAAVRAGAGLPTGLEPAVFPWRIQISRNRPARGDLGQPQQVSVLAVTNSATAHCPLRFARLNLVAPAAGALEDPAPVRADLPAPVLTVQERQTLRAPELTVRWAAERRDAWHAQWLAAFDKLENAAGWNALSAKARLDLNRILFPGAQGRPPERSPLNACVVYERGGDGFKVQGLIFETRPGQPEPATLFLPAAPAKEGEKRPALVVLPAHHTPRNNPDLYMVGANLARAGGMALLLDTLGSGECSTVARWEHKSYQRWATGTQLTLAGEEAAGHIVWSISRAADLLLERADADPARLGILGGVAGGGDLVAEAAAFDARFTLCIPFNFSSCKPFGGYYDPPRSLRGSQPTGLSPWMIDALCAPRQFIQAQEFAWEDSCKDAYARFEKVYGLLEQPKNLSFLHGGKETHATHFAGLHRRPMYRILNDWWKLTLPVEEAAEFKASFSAGEMECFTAPEGLKYLDALQAAGRLTQPHEAARQAAAGRLAAARQRRKVAGAAVRDALDKVCGPSQPLAAGEIAARDLGRWREAAVRGWWLPAEAGKPEARPGVAVWLLEPAGQPGSRPVVVCLAQAGKAAFLAARAKEIGQLLQNGVAVALVDVRACGETAPTLARGPESPIGDLAAMLWLQQDSLPARQLKDLRTALAFLALQPGVDASRMAIWGEGLTEPNAASGGASRFDETGFRQSGPVAIQLAEPLGGWLALAAALYPVNDAKGAPHKLRAVLARGTVYAFAAVLDRRYHYLPTDAIIPDLLCELDVADVAGDLRANGITLLAEDLRDGSNRPVSVEALQKAWGASAPEGYTPQITSRAVPKLLEALKR